MLKFQMTADEAKAAQDTLSSDTKLCQDLVRKMAAFCLRQDKKSKLVWSKQLANFTVVSLISDKKSPSGQACTFLQKSGLGIKCYATEYGRSEAHANQLKAEEFGIAPMTGASFDINMRIGNTNVSVYGYLTEIANTSRDVREMAYSGATRYDTLVEKMQDNGFGVGDLHSGNVGMIGDEFVCIDFDNVSMGCGY